MTSSHRLPLTAALALGLASVACAGSPSGGGARTRPAPSYAWQSPQGWRGGTFSVPPAFAPELGFRGREVLRFSPGYYDEDAHDFWTYAFVFLLPADADVSPEYVEPQLTEYFRGLGANLGSHARADLPRSEIDVQRVADEGSWHRARIRAFDPWETGAAIDLNVEWSARPCEGDARQALLFKISPLPYDDTAWSELASEAASLRCR